MVDLRYGFYPRVFITNKRGTNERGTFTIMNGFYTGEMSVLISEDS